MANILVPDVPIQSSSSPIVLPKIYALGSSVQGTSGACVIDITPPTFTGLASLNVESRGQLRATWLTGSDITLPIRYEIYVRENTSVDLFNQANIIAITDKLQYDIFIMPDGSFLNNGSTYYVGVRALDGVGNRDNNTVVDSVISTGVFFSNDQYKINGAFTIGQNNKLQGTMWVDKNSELCLQNLGVASYQVYDKDGNIVVGASEINIFPDSNGQYKITPIDWTMDYVLNHYVIKMTIKVDSEFHTEYTSMILKQPNYYIQGTAIVNNQGYMNGSFWVNDYNGAIVSEPSRLGLGSYEVIGFDGLPVPGFSENNIVPTSEGMYVMTPIPGITPDMINGIKGKLTIVVDGVPRTSIQALAAFPDRHDIKAQFGINALNQFIANFWVDMSGHVMLSSEGLGIASYQVYDVNGLPVSGLTESGLVSDSNGRFNITPVSAVLLTDLTLYTVAITISIRGTNQTIFKGFSILGT